MFFKKFGMHLVISHDLTQWRVKQGIGRNEQKEIMMTMWKRGKERIKMPAEEWR